MLLITHRASHWYLLLFSAECIIGLSFTYTFVAVADDPPVLLFGDLFRRSVARNLIYCSTLIFCTGQGSALHICTVFWKDSP